MSRKTKLALPPGTKFEDLNWEDENHRRYIEDEAYDAYFGQHPKPVMAPPPRSRVWWFWRFFGELLYSPTRRLLHAYMSHDYVKGQNEFYYPGAASLYNWIRGGVQKGPNSFWLRRILHWITDIHAYGQCLCCGYGDYSDEIMDPADPDGPSLDMFEHVDGGGVDYWGEGQDAHGWLWCYRCGNRQWESV